MVSRALQLRTNITHLPGRHSASCASGTPSYSRRAKYSDAPAFQLCCAAAGCRSRRPATARTVWATKVQGRGMQTDHVLLKKGFTATCLSITTAMRQQLSCGSAGSPPGRNLRAGPAPTPLMPALFSSSNLLSPERRRPKYLRRASLRSKRRAERCGQGRTCRS